MRKICFVTGTRAEYGLLSRLMRLVKDDLLSTNLLTDNYVIIDVKATRYRLQAANTNHNNYNRLDNNETLLFL